MNENLFTFPGGTAEKNGDNPFDLSGFTELTGNDSLNPFADLLAMTVYVVFKIHCDSL